MRVRVTASAAGADLLWDQSVPALPSVSWDPDSQQLQIGFGRPADGARIQVSLGPAESAELYRRIRETYPPAQTRQRGRSARGSA